jgi:hypothetical protein
MICASSILGCALLAAVAFAEPQRGAVANDWFSESELHGYFMDMFLDSPGNGISRMYSPFMRVPPDRRLTIECEYDDKTVVAMGQYRVESIELIGVAKHPTPKVFPAANHATPINRQVRDLTSFEQKALTALRNGRVVFSQMENPTHATVVGAVSARRECVGCHQAKVGDLLGAFSYRLAALSPVKK